MHDRMAEINQGNKAFGVAEERNPFQLWIVRKDCTIITVPYISIGPADGNHRGKVVINCSPQFIVEISGRNLMPIHEAIQQNRCTFILEGDGVIGQKHATTATWVENVEIHHLSAHYSTSIH